MQNNSLKPFVYCSLRRDCYILGESASQDRKCLVYVACKSCVIYMYVEWEHLCKPSMSKVIYPVQKHSFALFYCVQRPCSLCLVLFNLCLDEQTSIIMDRNKSGSKQKYIVCIGFVLSHVFAMYRPR